MKLLTSKQKYLVLFASISARAIHSIFGDFTIHQFLIRVGGVCISTSYRLIDNIVKKESM